MNHPSLEQELFQGTTRGLTDVKSEVLRCDHRTCSFFSWCYAPPKFLNRVRKHGLIRVKYLLVLL